MSRGQSLIGVALLLCCREGATASAASTEQTSVTERSQRVRATFARGSFELTMECDRPGPLVLARAADGVWSLKRGQEVLKGSRASGLAGVARASVGDNADVKACVTGARQDALDAHLAMSARVLIALESAVFGERVVIGTLPEVAPSTAVSDQRRSAATRVAATRVSAEPMRPTPIARLSLSWPTASPRVDVAASTATCWIAASNTARLPGQTGVDRLVPSAEYAI